MSNAPDTFLTIIDEAFSNQVRRNVLIYLEKSVVFSPTKEEHLKDLQ